MLPFRVILRSAACDEESFGFGKAKILRYAQNDNADNRT